VKVRFSWAGRPNSSLLRLAVELCFRSIRVLKLDVNFLTVKSERPHLSFTMPGFAVLLRTCGRQASCL
jgi:hypothetical protein